MTEISKLIHGNMSKLHERIKAEQCPFCGAEKNVIIYDSPEIDGVDALQACSCIDCEGEWTEAYRFHRVLLSDETGKFHVILMD